MEWVDAWRRQIGEALDVVGWGPEETTYRVIAEITGARLRAYSNPDSAPGPILLIVPAPSNALTFGTLCPR